MQLQNAFLTMIVAASMTVPVISFSAKSALAEDLSFILINGTTYTLTNFYVSPIQIDNWENDILGTDMLLPGGQIQVIINDGRNVCNYDIKGVFSDGSSATRYDVDLCSLNEGIYTLVE